MPLVATGDDSGQPEAFVEYTAEGVTGPCCMLRRGSYKYVYTHGHPDLLFDMEADPNELVNIAQRQPRGRSPNSRSRVLARWDPEAITQQVLASQARRKFINSLPEAHPAGLGLPGQHRRHAPLRAPRQCPGDQGQEALAAAAAAATK